MVSLANGWYCFTTQRLDCISGLIARALKESLKAHRKTYFLQYQIDKILSLSIAFFEYQMFPIQGLQCFVLLVLQACQLEEVD